MAMGEITPRTAEELQNPTAKMDDSKLNGDYNGESFFSLFLLKTRARGHCKSDVL